MMNNDEQVLNNLKTLGLINTDINSNVLNNHSQDLQDRSPWFIHVFFGFSGFLASLFFIGFLTLLLQNIGVLDSAMANFVIGMVLIIAGFILFKHKRLRHRMFANSLAFTIGMAGQSYMAYALISSDVQEPFGVWLFLLFQSVMTFIMPNFIFRILSSLIAFGCMVYLLNYYHLPETVLGLLALIVVIINLQPYMLLQSVSINWRATIFDTIKAIGYASALMLICVSVYFMVAEYGDSVDNYNAVFRYNYYVAQGLLTLASLYGAVLILRRYQVKLLSTTGIIIGCTVAILGIVSIYVSGLLATSLVILIAVANSQRFLLGLGIAALVSYIFWYYYQLDTSLLVKSASMFIVGMALFIVRWLVIKQYFSHVKIGANDDQERLS